MAVDAMRLSPVVQGEFARITFAHSGVNFNGVISIETTRTMLNARELVGTHHILFITLDTLRYDVAISALLSGRTPNLAARLPGGMWEQRHTPGSFTYAAHHAFFAGFLPTPAAPGRHPRLFAAKFPGTVTATEQTYVFEAPDMVTGLAQVGYHTICIGGVHFFNKQSALGNVLPDLFAESYWDESMGVNDPNSTENQVNVAVQALRLQPRTKPIFLFVNISAMHQPNYFYLPGATEDSVQSQAAALAYVDQHLPMLFLALQRRGPTLVIICSDHGTTYGEDGYTGHRLSHPVVWNVPYAEFILPAVAV